MKKTVEIKAATVELAIEEGLKELNAPLEKVEVDILSKGGLFQKAVVKITKVEQSSEKAEKFVNSILSNMRLKAQAKAEDDGDCITVKITGEDSAGAIGFRGEVLDAIQYLTLTVANNDEKSRFKKIVIDCEDYREKREQTLIALANRLAEKALGTRSKIKLEPMNPYERRIIHTALQGSDIAETISEGEEPNRYVVIVPKGVEIMGTTDAREKRGGDRRGARDSRGGQRGRDRGGFSQRGGDRGGFGGQRNSRYNSVPRPERDRSSYGDYDDLEPAPPKDDADILDPLKRTQPFKIKSFGNSKKYPFR